MRRYRNRPRRPVAKRICPARYAVFVEQINKQQRHSLNDRRTRSQCKFQWDHHTAGHQRANSLPSRTQAIGHLDLSKLFRKRADERIVTQIQRCCWHRAPLDSSLPCATYLVQAVWATLSAYDCPGSSPRLFHDLFRSLLAVNSSRNAQVVGRMLK